MEPPTASTPAAVNSFCNDGSEFDSSHPVEEQKSVSTATTITAETTEQSPTDINAGGFDLSTATKCVQSLGNITAGDMNNGGTTVPEQRPHLHSGGGQHGGTTSVKQLLDNSDEPSPPSSLSNAIRRLQSVSFRVNCMNVPAGDTPTED